MGHFILQSSWAFLCVSYLLVLCLIFPTLLLLPALPPFPPCLPPSHANKCAKWNRKNIVPKQHTTCNSSSSRHNVRSCKGPSTLKTTLIKVKLMKNSFSAGRPNKRFTHRYSSFPHGHIEGKSRPRAGSNRGSLCRGQGTSLKS